MDTHFSRKKSSILFPSCAFVRFVGLVCFSFMFSVLLFSVDDGAAIIMDADSGQILLLDNPHYAVEKAFPPGSLIKVFSALYGLQQKQFEPTSVVTCKGNISLFDTNFACWNTAGHGVINLYKALAYSCNVYFYSWGQFVNGADYVSFLRSFGLGSKTGVDGYEEEAGTLLEPTNQQEVAQLFVGASTRIEVTPLQMLTAYAAIVNGGKRIVPFLKVAQNQAEPLESIDIPTYYPIIERALQEAATYGTAAPFYEETGGFGKTGTAVWAEGFRTHGWFLGYLPVPCGDRIRRIVLIVFKLEGAGAKDALPEGLKLAKDFLQRARDQQQLSVSLF